jgi:hypothetical protein
MRVDSRVWCQGYCKTCQGSEFLCLESGFWFSEMQICYCTQLLILARGHSCICARYPFQLVDLLVFDF